MFQFIPNMGLQGGPQYSTVPPPGSTPSPQGGVDNRPYYNASGFQTNYTDPGDPNAGRVGGAPLAPKLGPSGYQLGQGAYGVVPIGGYSQLGGRLNGQYSGYQNPDFGAPIPGSNATPFPSSYASPYGTPKPPEPPQQPGSAGRVAPHVPEVGKLSWGGGIGTSDNSAWGNALGPTYESSVHGGPLQTAAYQPQGHTNQALPMGYGSVFGLGGGAGAGR